jgi:alpha-beta hydrolase superfamily lysophospholipase
MARVVALALLLIACGDTQLSEVKGLRFEELRIDYSGIPDLVEFPARDGTRLPYRHYPAQSDVHLVLLHGSGYHSRYLFALAREISAQNAAHVYTPDLRGHGISPARRGDIDYIDQLEDDLSDLFAHIKDSHPDARLVLGGHSSGGGLALRFGGGQYGRKVSGFLLLSPFLGHDAPTTRPNSGGWASPKLPRLVGLSILNSLGIEALNGVVAIEFRMPEEYRDGTETLAYSFRLTTGFSPRDFESDLISIKVPVLVLVGSDDEAFIADQYQPSIAQLAPQAQIRVLDGVSHLGVVLGSASPPHIVNWLSTLSSARPTPR